MKVTHVDKNRLYMFLWWQELWFVRQDLSMTKVLVAVIYHVTTLPL